MKELLLLPPVAFLILLLLFMGLGGISKRIAARGKDTRRKGDAYACGESVGENQGQPEYSQFFHFAFFFTIMHVTVLIIATDAKRLSLMAMFFLMLTLLSLLMLFRRERDDR